MSEEELDDAQTPARGYLIAAGIPAGLLLWLGCAYVLKHAGAGAGEAGATLVMIKVMSWTGLAIALASLLALLFKPK